MQEELFNFVAGKKLGSGSFRDVYVWKPDPSYVLKVAQEEDGQKHNLLEMALWEAAEDTKAEKWFAPCLRVSTSGKYLIMKRAKLGPTVHYKKMLPAFFSDTHCKNWGWIGKDFVCFDYAFFDITKGFNSKMVKKIWCDCP